MLLRGLGERVGGLPRFQPEFFSRLEETRVLFSKLDRCLETSEETMSLQKMTVEECFHMCWTILGGISVNCGIE